MPAGDEWQMIGFAFARAGAISWRRARTRPSSLARRMRL
jgi:hypothetical protein